MDSNVTNHNPYTLAFTMDFNLLNLKESALTLWKGLSNPIIFGSKNKASLAISFNELSCEVCFQLKLVACKIRIHFLNHPKTPELAAANE